MSERDYAGASDELQHLAEQGEVNAQYNLSLMYDIGMGVPQDDALAAYWFRQAAEQGHADAQYNLGGMYFFGRGVPQDETQALEWFRKAAEQGHARAKSSLAMGYTNCWDEQLDDS
jgi:uncharacterized protein